MTTISWINGASGNWSDGANWSDGSEPGSADDVSLSGTATYAVTLDVPDSILGLTLSDASAALVLDQTLKVTDTLHVDDGSVQIDGGGGLAGGVLSIGKAGSAVLNGGSLKNVQVDGTLVATDTGGSSLTGQISFAGAAGTGMGTFDYDDGNYFSDNYLYTEGNTTLSGAKMNIGNTGTGGSVNILYAQDSTGKGAILTLGATFILNEVAGNSALQGTDGSGDAIINLGTIDAVTDGGDLQIDATKFVNKGTIKTADGGVVFFTGKIAASLIDSVTIEPGGYVGIDGTVDGGTLVATKGQVGSYGGSGVLHGVALQGDFTVEDGGFTLDGANSFAGANGVGAATLNFDQGNYYSANYLTALGSQTLNNLVLNIGNTGSGGSVNILQSKDATGNGETLTLGAGCTLNAVAGNSALVCTDGPKDAVVNLGTIHAVTSGGELQIDANTFHNDGLIDTAKGGVVFFTGTMNAGLLDSVTEGSGGYLGIDGIVTGGTLVTPDGQIGSYDGSGELDGVTVHGTLTIEDSGFTLTGQNVFAGNDGAGPATLNFDLGNSYSNNDLTALGSQTLNNLVLNIGNTGLGGSSNILFSKDAAATGITLTLGAGFTLNAVQGNSAIAGTDGAGDEIVNKGTIEATTAGGNLQIDATAFRNLGSIKTANGGVAYFTGTIAAKLIDSVANGAGGYTGIDGTVDGGTIVSADGQVGSFGSDGVLNGVTVQGTFTIEDGPFTLMGANRFSGVDGGGIATLNYDQGESYSTDYLYAQGNETLNNAILNIGNTGLGGSTNELFNQDVTGTGATLTLGSGFTLNAVQGNSEITGTDGAGDAIINDGTIDVTTDGAVLTIDETKFTNNGVINVANGGVLKMVGGSAVAGLIAFSGRGDSLVLTDAHAMAARLGGFGDGDSITVTGQTITSVLWSQSSATGGTLQLIGAGGILGDISLAGSYVEANFAVSSGMHAIDFVAATGAHASSPEAELGAARFLSPERFVSSDVHFLPYHS